MTRRDQTLRAWIQRESPRHCWQSMVSHKTKVHQKTTGTRIRKAALEFNRLHILAILNSTRTNDTQASAHQSEIFPEIFPIAY